MDFTISQRTVIPKFLLSCVDAISQTQLYFGFLCQMVIFKEPYSTFNYMYYSDWCYIITLKLIYCCKVKRKKKKMFLFPSFLHSPCS